MAYKLPYNSLPNLGDLQAGDIVPVLRPPFQEGSAFVSDVQKYVRPYAVYTALLSQSGTDDPTVIVLENSIGEIVWTRDQNGGYLATLTNAFPQEKTFILITANSQGIDLPFFTANWNTVDNIVVYTLDGNTVTYTDGLLINTPFEIRVYYSEPA